MTAAGTLAPALVLMTLGRFASRSTHIGAWSRLARRASATTRYAARPTACAWSARAATATARTAAARALRARPTLRCAAEAIAASTSAGWSALAATLAAATLIATATAGTSAATGLTAALVATATLTAATAASATAISTAAASATITAAASAASSIGTLAGTIRASVAALRARRFGFGLSRLSGQNIALVNPYFDTDVAIRRCRFGKSIVNVSTEGVERNFALAILLFARHFRAGKPSGTHHANSLDAQLHGAKNRLPHSPLVRNALFNLLRNAFGDQLRVLIRLSDFVDRNMHLLFGQFFQFGFEEVNALSLPSDDDTGFGRVQGRFYAVAAPLNFHAGNSGIGKDFMLLNIAANFVIFIHGIGETALGEIPLALRVANDADPKSDWVYFLAHSFSCGEGVEVGSRE